MALGKVQKTCRFRMFLCAICHKKRLAGHVSEYLCKWLGWVYQCEDFTFRFTNSFVQMQIPLINPWYYAYHVIFMRPHYLLYTYLPLIPASFLFSIKLCERLSNLLILVPKQMKVLQMNRIFPFFSLFVYSFSAIAWESVQTISV